MVLETMISMCLLVMSNKKPKTLQFSDGPHVLLYLNKSKKLHARGNAITHLQSHPIARHTMGDLGMDGNEDG